MSIIIKNLNKIYPNGNHALKDVNLEIPAGMFGLLGPNGAGKSTLMRILVALMEPTSGQVEICGYDLMKQRKEIRGILGYLPQDFRFFAKYKTYEFLDYAARLSGMTHSRQRKQAVDEMLENVGLFDVRERYANKLSGGMKRRLGIAQALIGNPDIVLLDEPTAGLDPEERLNFKNVVREIKKDRCVVLSTHIITDIESLCDKILILSNGVITQFNSCDELADVANGKVFAVNSTDNIDAPFYSMGTIYIDGKTYEKVICLNKIDALPLAPTVEDGYICFIENLS